MFVVVAALVFLVALGANRPPEYDILVDRSFDSRFGVAILIPILVGSFLVTFGTLVYVLRGNVADPRDLARGRGRRPLSRWAKAVAGVLMAAYIGGWVAAILVGRGDLTERPPTSPTSLSQPGEGAPADGGASFLVVQWWVLALAAALVLAAPAVVLLFRRRHTAWRRTTSPDRQELRKAVEASLKDLEQGTDYRRAVIRAYATMEHVLAEHGLARHRSEAPFEYLSRWTSALQLGRPTAEALTALYEWAKFSPHVVDERMHREATEALLALRRELEEQA